MYKVLSAESCFVGDTPASINSSGSQSKSPIKKLPGLLQQIFYILAGKQGGGATVLREMHDIVTRETWFLLL
jgi:hypothetical protein